MTDIRIIPYESSWRDDVLDLSIAAWTPFFAKMADDVPRFIYDAF